MNIQEAYSYKMTYVAAKTSHWKMTIIHTQQELRDQMDKLDNAFPPNVGRMREVDELYRNTPRKIMNSMEEYGLMEMRRKDHSGHMRCPINRKLEGLFFQANVNGFGKPPIVSFYGSRRMHVKSYQMLQDCRLFFTDFSCLKPDKKSFHYVIIVAVPAGSQAESFCLEYLLELDPNDPRGILRVDAKNKVVSYRHYSKLTVEVLYTEDINIAEGKKTGTIRFSNCVAKGKTSKNGLLHEHYCSKCDIETLEAQKTKAGGSDVDGGQEVSHLGYQLQLFTLASRTTC